MSSRVDALYIAKAAHKIVYRYARIIIRAVKDRYLVQPA